MEYRFVWIAVGWTMVAAGVAISLFPAPISHIGLNSDGRDIHVLAYFVFMVWLAQLYPSYTGRITVAVGLVLMGMGIEVLQSLQPDRVGNWPDAAANAVGVGLGWLALGTPLSNSIGWLDRRMTKLLSK